MDNLGDWLEHLKHPMVLAGFVLFVLVGLLKMFMGSKDLSATNERILHKGMNFVFILGVLIIVGGFAYSIVSAPPAPASSAAAAPLTTGDQSPVVSGSQGDVNINFGAPPVKQ